MYEATAAFESFQIIIEQVIADGPGTKSFSGPIIIWASSSKEISERLQELFQILHNHGLRSDEAIQADVSQVDAIRNAEPPANVTEVRSFSGLLNLEFIPNYADLTKPLRNLTRKHVTSE